MSNFNFQNNVFPNNQNKSPHLEGDFEENKHSLSSESNPYSMSFDQPLSQGLMQTGNPNGMFFPPYMNQYMGYPYGYMNPQRYNYQEKRGNQGYRKSQGYTQVVYAKKPKSNMQENNDTLTNSFANMNIDEKKTDSNGKIAEKLPHKIEKAQFFVIKSYSEEDIHKAIKYNVWCSTKEGNVKLHNAYVTANNEYPIYLLFSVNSSGHFVGAAKMKSTVDFDKNFEGWGQNHKWKGVFKISWVYIKDIPNRELRHLKNEFNDNKPVPNSRDCQEVPFDIGVQVLEIFEKYKNQTSILDDYEYYEMQEKGGFKS